MSGVFAVRGPDVVHDTIDGETVIVDMGKGAYYRLEGAAALAWQALEGGADAACIAAVLLAHYDMAAEAAGAEAEEFLRRLVEYDLVVADTDAAPGATPAGQAANAARLPFPGFAIQQFTDLEELLFIDPVHEVDETGWPAQPPAR
ncbi:MAG: PqqD family protein [Rhodospirillaceae bacterium]|nr:PqqD family protein [Rhodospirillaceae bacterium]